MTSPHASHPELMARPACTPAAIRAVLAANADTEVLRRYDDELDAAFEQAREHGDLTPLLETVRRWWFEADAWRDPDAQREFLARIEKYQNEGPPPPRKPHEERRDSRAVRRLKHVPMGVGRFSSADIDPPDDLVLVVRIQWLGS